MSAPVWALEWDGHRARLLMQDALDHGLVVYKSIATIDDKGDASMLVSLLNAHEACPS